MRTIQREWNGLTLNFIFTISPSLKTGLFNWSKDYTTAAFYFDEAGIFFSKPILRFLVKSYKAESLFEKAVMTLFKNAEVNEKLHEFHFLS